MQTVTSSQSMLFAEQHTTTASSKPLKSTGHNSLVGSIGETYFDLWCLSNDVCVYTPAAQNARVDRIIQSDSGFLRVHIKTANLCEGGHMFTLWTTNAWRVRNGMDRCKEQSSEADYFACVGIFKNKMPELIWWLPYDLYKEKKCISLDSGMADLLHPPSGLCESIPRYREPLEGN